MESDLLQNSSIKILPVSTNADQHQPHFYNTFNNPFNIISVPNSTIQKALYINTDFCFTTKTSFLLPKQQPYV
jgi:hypothetical protein